MWKKDLKRGLAIALSVMLAVNVFQGNIWEARAEKKNEVTVVSQDSVAEEFEADANVETEQEIDVDQASTAGVEVTKFELKTREDASSPWQNVTQNMLLKDGAELSVAFEWKLDNESHLDRYVIDFGTDAKNIEMVNFDWKIYKEEGKEVARYRIEGNQFELEITDSEYKLTHSGRSGGFVMQGNVKINDAGLHYNSPYDIGLNSNLIQVRYDDGLPESDASVTKSTNGNIKKVGSDLIQEFKVTVTANKGAIKNLQFTEKPGTGLSNMSGITIVNAGGMSLATNYSSLTDFNTALSGLELAKDQKLEITYHMKVDPDIYKKNPEKTYSNGMELAYKSSHDIDKNPVTAWTDVKVEKPYVGKIGKTDDSGSYVTWTVTIKLGDLATHDPAKTTKDQLISELNSYISGFSDTIPNGACTVSSLTLDNAESITYNDTQKTYQITYKTDISTEYKNKPTQAKIENTVSFTYNGDTYSATGNAYTKGENWLGKSVVSDSFDPVNKTIKWKVTLTNIPENIHSVKLTDQMGGTDIDYAKAIGQHSVLAIEYEGQKIVENGALVTNDVADAFSGQTLSIKDSFIEAKKNTDITFTITSKLETAPANKVVFYNHANLTYITDSDVNGSLDAYAKWENKSYMDKKGMSVTGEYAINYTVGADLKHKAQTVGASVMLPETEIIIEDVYATDMEIDLSSVSGKLYTGWGDGHVLDPAAITKIIDVENHKLTLKYTITSTDNGGFAYFSSSDLLNAYSKVRIEFTYKAKIKDELKLIRDGVVKKVTNEAKGTYDSSALGTVKIENEITPKKVIEKDGVYHGNSDPNNDIETRRTVNYTIKVNPDRLDLAEASSVIELVDTLQADGKLFFDLSSVRIVKVNVGGARVPLSPSEYQIRKGSSDDQVVFVVPDATYLEITYNAKITDEAYNKKDNFTANNEVRISAIGNVSGGDDAPVNLVDFFGTDWITSENYSLDLYKCWSNNVLTALPGAEFQLIQMKYEGGVLSEDTTGIHKSIQITDDSAVCRITGLTADTVFALIETKAPAGYALETEPYYFVKEVTTTGRDYGAYTVHKFDAGRMITYSDEEAAILKITKNLVGGMTFDQVKDNMKFVVRDASDAVVYTIPATKMTRESDTVYSYTINDIKAGSYTVEEVTSGVSRPVSVGYQINGGTIVASDKITPIVLVEKTTTTVDFTNKYDGGEELGSILVEKELVLPAGLSKEEALENLSFTITRDGETTPAYTVAGTQLLYDSIKDRYCKEIPNVPVGTYKIKENMTGMSGYSVSTSHDVCGNLNTGLGPVTFAVTKDTESVAKFKNTYTQDKGKIKLEKWYRIDGSTPLDWNTIKDSLKFEVYSEDGTVVKTLTGNDLNVESDQTEAGETYHVYASAEFELPTGKYYTAEFNTALAGTAVIISSISHEVGGVYKNGEVSDPFLLQKDAGISVRYRNIYKTGTVISVSKKAITGSDELEGARLAIYKGTDETAITPGNLISTWTSSDTERKIGLADGDYILVETTAPKGYAKAEMIPFHLSGGALTGDANVVDGVNRRVTMKDKVFSVDVSKFDLGASEIPGAVIRIFEDGASCLDENGNVINDALAASQSLDTWVSTIGSTHNFGKVLSAGKQYWLVETSAPEGYAIATSVKFKVKDDGTIEETSTGTSADVEAGNPASAEIINTIILRDKPLHMKLNKVDLGGNEVDGATIALYEVNNTTVKPDGTVASTAIPVETWVSETGVIKDFGPGIKAGKTYVLKETIVPYGYQAAENIVFRVEKNGTITVNPGVEKTADGTVLMRDAEILPIIVITKTIEGDVTKEEAEGAIRFAVTDADTNMLYGTYTLRDGEYDATTGRWTITIPNVPAGKYYVTEQMTDITGQTLTKVTHKLSTQTEAIEGAVAESFIVSRGDTMTVDYKNTYVPQRGKLVITKTIKGDVTKEEAEGALQFKVTDNKTGESTTYKLTDFTYHATTGNYLLELDVKVGGYTIEETIYDITGHAIETVKYSVNGGEVQSGNKASAVVSKDAVTTVAFEDTYTKNKGTLVITKTMKGDVTKEEAEGVLQFTVTNNDTGVSQKYTLKDFKYDRKTKTWTLTLTRVPGGYTVEETVTDVKGYTLSGVKYTVDKNAAKKGKKTTVTVTSDTTTTVAYENSYKTNPDTGKIRITKMIAEDAPRKKAADYIAFTVTNQKTKKTKKYALSEFTYDAENKVFYLDIEANVGTYTVMETSTNIPGFELASVTIKVNGGNEENAVSATVNVVKDKRQRVLFTDRYKKTGSNTTTTTTTSSTTTSTGTTTTTTTTTTGLTKTGDEAPVGTWIALLLAGFAGIIGCIVVWRKKQGDVGETKR